MVVLHIEALAAIALCLSVLMAGAWLVQHRSGNSGWVDTIWTFSVGLVGAGSALWPVAEAAPNARQWPVGLVGAGSALWPVAGAGPNARQWLVAALVALWSLRLGSHIAVRTAGMFFPVPSKEGVVT